MYTSDKTLLLTDSAESALKWKQDLRQLKTNVVISTFQRDFLRNFPHGFDDTFALVIVDSNEADLSQNVLDICKWLRAQIDSPILLLTYDQDEAQLLQAYEAGIDVCIPKPVSATLLMAKANARLRFSAPRSPGHSSPDPSFQYQVKATLDRDRSESD